MSDDNLQELKTRLYKKEEAFKERGKRVRIYGGKEKTSLPYWQSPPKRKRSALRPLKIIFALVTVFFLISVGTLLYFWLKGVNIVSSRNIEIEMKGPVYARGGEIINIDIFIENRNNAVLEFADLILGFPQGSFSPEGNEMRGKRYSLGAIDPGGAIKKSVDFVLFGQEEEEKTMEVTLEYRLAQSNAIFAKTADYTIKISQPAVGISLLLPKEGNAGQEIKMEIGIVSNSETIVKGLAVQIEYPSGFQFTGAVPEPSKGGNIWRVGDIDPGQERKILARGIIEGQDLEEKAFHVTAGIIKDDVLLPYGAAVESFVVKKPFVDLVLFIDGRDSAENIAFSGDSLRLEILWKNNLSVPVRQGVIEMKIRGKVLNERSISVSGGFYRTYDKTLVWNSSSLPELASIEPGEIGRARFSFSILEPLPMSKITDKNFIVALEGQISGRAISALGEDIKIFNDIKREIKIGSQLQIASMALHYSGPFKNTGPMPPKVGQETAYTIVWSLGNSSNDFSDVKVNAILPSYMRWLSNVSPQDADVSFDDVSGEVVWNTGNVSAGTGIIRPAKEVAFQIALSPSVSQIESSPDLITETVLEARDDFINKMIKDTRRALTTRLLNDPKSGQRESKVVE